MIGVAVLGATGSIGDSTLDVCAQHPDRFRVVALGARRNVAKLLEQCARFRPERVALADADAAGEFEQRARRAGLRVEVLAGPQGLVELASMPSAEFVMAAIVGAAGPSRRWQPRARASACCSPTRKRWSCRARC